MSKTASTSFRLHPSSLISSSSHQFIPLPSSFILRLRLRDIPLRARGGFAGREVDDEAERPGLAAHEHLPGPFYTGGVGDRCEVLPHHCAVALLDHEAGEVESACPGPRDVNGRKHTGGDESEHGCGWRSGDKRDFVAVS